MFCGKCGAQVPEAADRCPVCAHPVDPSGEPSAPVAPARKKTASLLYAGFWLRLVALALDMLIILLVSSPIMFDLLSKNLGPQPTINQSLDFIRGGSRQAIAINLLFELIFWLYYAALESSVWQATLGKRAMGLYVSDLSGRRLSFARASGRYFARILSRLTLGFGFVLAGFTTRKQALHDMIAGCLVLRKP